ncbi:MAG: hypothetical protein ACD_78C00064G0003 [uncultured bacterium (gcode 4)]|uniref:Uncharacterized protein n=1 Tax=uncultured bacterium (gcode 4) TaxID=1234023 RepID=K1YYC3_9BACT|nr:MAG: hypothetical protein ACD_78C00064G0003 [uncultured bacterium (gcode 4)]
MVDSPERFGSGLYIELRIGSGGGFEVEKSIWGRGSDSDITGSIHCYPVCAGSVITEIEITSRSRV